MQEKAIKELRKFERFPTPNLKLRYLLNSFMIVNNIFNLFSSDKENQLASADDMLNIFPYIVIKTNIKQLMHHIK